MNRNIIRAIFSSLAIMVALALSACVNKSSCGGDNSCIENNSPTGPSGGTAGRCDESSKIWVYAPNGTTVAVGQTLTLADSVSSNTCADKSVWWRSGNPGIASIDSVTGLVRGVAPGSVVIIARLRSDTTKTGSITLQVTGPTSSGASGIRLVLSPTNLVFHTGVSCAKSQTYQLLYEVQMGTSSGWTRTTDQAVNFSASTAGVVSLSPTSGLINMSFTQARTGSTNVVGVPNADPTKSASMTVVVDAVACDNTGINPSGNVTITVTAPGGTSMPLGTSKQLVVTTNAADPTVTWSSSDPSKVLVNAQTGIVTAFGHGAADICATLRTNPTKALPGCITITVP